MITLSHIFKSAHETTKRVMQAGDNYAATFSIVLKRIYAVVNTTKTFEKSGMFGKSFNTGRKFYEVDADQAQNFIGKTINISELTDTGLKRGFRSRGYNTIKFTKFFEFTASIIGKEYMSEGKKKVRLYGDFISNEEAVYDYSKF